MRAQRAGLTVTIVLLMAAVGCGSADESTAPSDHDYVTLPGRTPPAVQRDLRDFGGPSRGWVKDDVVQEVDVATGRVLFEWSSLDHIPLADSLLRLPADEYGAGTRDDPWDFAHVNSVTEDGDSLLISARNTCAIYRVDRTTGDVAWTLGGRSNDFRFVGDARFAWQHNAQRQPDGTIIGWGAGPHYSEFTSDGQLLLDADFGSGESYRIYRMPWLGRPTTLPTLDVVDGTAFVRWNGATEVAAWRFLAGADADDASVVTTAPRDGFETSVDVPDQPYVAAQALDADGTVLGTAGVVVVD